MVEWQNLGEICLNGMKVNAIELFGEKRMRPLDFYIKNIEKQWTCKKCDTVLESMREVKSHCTEQGCVGSE